MLRRAVGGPEQFQSQASRDGEPDDPMCDRSPTTRPHQLQVQRPSPRRQPRQESASDTTGQSAASTGRALARRPDLRVPAAPQMQEEEGHGGLLATCCTQYWSLGMCANGTQCTFAHDARCLRARPSALTRYRVLPPSKQPSLLSGQSWVLFCEEKHSDNPQHFLLKVFKPDAFRAMQVAREEALCPDHPNIVKPVGIHWESITEAHGLASHLPSGTLECHSAVYPRWDGDLVDFVSRRQDTHGQRELRNVAPRVMTHLLQALKCLHAHGIVHRDIKLENVLFESTADGYRFAACDMSSMKPLNLKDQTTATDAGIDTPRNRTPPYTEGYSDARIGSDHSFTVNDTQYDVWCAARVLFAMYHGKPFAANTAFRKAFERVRGGALERRGEYVEYITDVPGVGGELLRWMLTMRREDRPTAADALAKLMALQDGTHSFFDPTEKGPSFVARP